MTTQASAAGRRARQPTHRAQEVRFSLDDELQLISHELLTLDQEDAILAEKQESATA
jgi:hypothetical protein